MADSPAPLPPELVREVLSLSTSHGEPRPETMVYVATTRSAAEALVRRLPPDVHIPPEDEPMWLIQLRGHFVARRGPSSQPPATGTVMHLLVHRATPHVRAISIGDQAVDLRRLGTPGLA
jgi:hypothetical protein